MKFSVLSEDNHSLARTGLIETDHSKIETPVFMPVGTHGVVKTLSPDDLNDMNEIKIPKLFNLDIDPIEINDIAKDNQQIVKAWYGNH